MTRDEVTAALHSVEGLTLRLPITPDEWSHVRHVVDLWLHESERERARERAVAADREWWAARATEGGWEVPSTPWFSASWASVDSHGRLVTQIPPGSGYRDPYTGTARAVSAPGAHPRWRVAGGRVAHRPGHEDYRRFCCGVPIRDVRAAPPDLRACPSCFPAQETP